MYISYNWLKDFVRLPAKIKPETVAAELTGHTVEVEGLNRQADQFSKVVVGRVLEVRPHPNADRLRLTVVDVKTKRLEIVCGAPNVAVGQLVPVALVGAKLPNGLEIKESLIRGEKSSGMICAEDELGLGKEHAGILVLRDNAKVGLPFAKYLSADDIVLEIDNKSLSNRPDLLNHYGLARELAAIFNLPLKPYEKFYQRKWDAPGHQTHQLSVKVEDSERCPRYLAVRVDNIKVQESPAWLKARLISIGQRPINNIVDLTNYVMFDCGQPMHAFDAAAVKKIEVRRAAANESVETLDEQERILDNGDLVITDGRKILAIAGVMGARHSGVTSETTALVLESANFLAPAVRRTAQKLGLRTEASVRFEKSLDPLLAESAMFRFLTLLQDLCPEMKLAGVPVDVNNSQSRPVAIELDLDWLAGKIGQVIPRAEILGGLKRLGFTIKNESAESEPLSVVVPSWRATKDVSRREDLAEEVLRLYGYDQIVSHLPVLPMNEPEANEARQLERRIKQILAWKHSLNEAYNYSFVGEEQLKKLNIDFFQHLRLVNPLAETQGLLRQSLVPGLVGNIKTNQARNEDFGFFEIGTVFFRASGNLPKDVANGDFLPYQEKRLGLALAGGGDLFDRLKGLLASLLKNLVDHEVAVEFAVPEHCPGWAHEYAAAKVMAAGRELGLIAALRPSAYVDLNLKKSVVLAEINLPALAELVFGTTTHHFQELPKYPPVSRDLAFVVEPEILYNDVRREILQFDPLIRSVELFDVYTGDQLSGGQKSLAFHILYQSPDQTLTAEAVDTIQQSLVEHLVQKFGGRLRDF
ncbi:MAG: phenylalanine--tRNA ligase subunit beta [Patescibacteria group bacterium]